MSTPLDLRVCADASPMQTLRWRADHSKKAMPFKASVRPQGSTSPATSQLSHLTKRRALGNIISCAPYTTSPRAPEYRADLSS